ncbi:hypothetical protein N7532_010522 [Penicillium argentinense]|uniref:Sec39 domain-containing protein n=1 Tax=Penicillium argentinense TaxID=1131581 RepID=A0A9W9EQ17_9EURO|nr:uncharacterized protein N7532_010522 [Penicillium argentinense]KAJ5085751.1 hypothetical protein N7532_010522 [Penicillium argentinense]
MAPLEGLSDAHAILLATRFCAEGNVAALPALQAQYPHCFPLERLLRIILTFLPESTEPSDYIPVLQELVSGNSTDRDIDASAVQDLSESAARKRVRKLRLRSLKREDEEEEVLSSDPLTQFLIHRAHLIDSETALQPLILSLVLPFHENNPTVRTWLVSSLLPALRLNYEYYPNREETISLDTLELMDDQTAVNVLLSISGPENNSMDLINNLRGLVGPWLYGSDRSKRRRLNDAAHRNSVSFLQGTSKPETSEPAGWDYVNEWLLSRSFVDRENVISAFSIWNGPQDVDMGGYEDKDAALASDKATELLNRYGQSGLAVVYGHADSSKAALEGSLKVLERVAKLLNLEECLYLGAPESALPSVDYDSELLSSTTRASLMQNSLLSFDNPLTRPSPSSISLLSALLLSLRILTGLGHNVPCRAVANMCLYSSEKLQMAELKSVVNSTVKQHRSSREWRIVRDQFLWLRDWQWDESDNGWDEPSTHQGLFWRISRDTVEAEILKALLGAREYQLAIEIYTQSASAPLKSTQVEEAVVESIYSAYDNASNGNRTRGGMKRAHETLQAFQPHFSESTALKQISALISATHALSFYSLTLQHGVPFQPVSIRVHHDPLSLVEKVLDQNAKSYTKLDDLLSIGRNLVSAGLSTSPETSEPLSEADALVTAERRITSLAISSALTSNDFGTAYSYILTRLTPNTLNTSTLPDDITWRAVYNAGRYRSNQQNTPLTTQITHLSQRMELLSLSLTLTPTPDPLPEILGAWRRADEELSSLRAREQSEEDAWDSKGDKLSTVPGGFGPSDFERDAFETAQQRSARRARARALPHAHPEAPMGLFEVARGAAMALHKNAFPLRGTGTQAGSTRAGVEGSGSGDERPLSPEGEGRVRKRDMVSNMVTGGLASGIGWVLGAEPVNR